MTTVDSADRTHPLVFTVPEAARMLGISRDSAYAAVARGEIPSLRIGKRLVVPRTRLLALVDGANVGELPPAA